MADEGNEALSGLQLSHILASYITEASSRSPMKGEVQVGDFYVDVEGAKSGLKSVVRALYRVFHPDANKLDEADQRNPLAVARNKKELDYAKKLSDILEQVDTLRAKSGKEFAKAVIGFYQNGTSGGDDALLAQASGLIDHLEGRLREKDAELASARTALRDALEGRRGFRSPNDVIVYAGSSPTGEGSIVITMGNAQATIDKLLREGIGDKRKEEQLARDLTAAQRELKEVREGALNLQGQFQRADRAYTDEKQKREALERRLTKGEQDHAEHLRKTRAGYDSKIEGVQAEANARGKEAASLRHDLNELKGRYTGMQEGATALITGHARDLASARKAGQQLEERLKDLTQQLDAEQRAAQLGSATMLTTARQLRDAGQLDDALTICSAVLLLDPDNVDARFHEGTIYEQQGRLVHAARAYQSVLQARADHTWAPPRIAGIEKKLIPAITKLRDTGQYSAAMDHCATLEEISPGSQTHAMYLRATIQEAQGDHLAALRSYHAALEQKTDYKPARKGLENTKQSILQRAKELRKTEPITALEYCQAVLTIDPQNVNATYTAGTVQESLGRPDIAKACFEQVLALQPGNTYAQKGVQRVSAA